MKANNFTVDDWILYDGKPYKIISVTKRKVGLHVHRYTATYIRLQHVEPIEITEEILSNNGFENGYWVNEDNLDEFIEFKRAKDGHWMLTVNSKNFSGRAFVNYVHEAQNIIRHSNICKRIIL